MSTLAGEFWVCGDCRSINNAGARQCYNCRTPRDRAAVDPSEIDPSTHGRLREIELPEFRASRWAAMLATVLILAVAVLQVVQFNVSAALIDQILGGTAGTLEQLVYVGSVGILAFGVVALALIAVFAAQYWAGISPIAVVVAIVAVAVVGSGGELSRRSILGAYTPLGESAPVGAHGIPQILWHAFDVAVLGLGVPALALSALAARSFSLRDRNPRLRAFVSTTLAYSALLVVQVGLFSSVYVGYVAERYLVTLLPLLAVGLCAWISRGAPRERRVVVPVWVALIALAALVPLEQLLTPGAIVNTFTPAPLAELDSEALQRLALVAAAVAAGALVLFVPPRRAWICAAVVGIGLALVSADTVRLVRDASAHENRAAVGSAPPGWLDDARIDDATLLVNGDRIWTSIARTVFWNRAVRDVVRIEPAEVPFPPDTPAVSVGEDGVLRTEDGNSLDRGVVVAPDTLTLAGEPLLGRPQGDSDVPGLTAWRVEPPARVVLSRVGFLPNGDFVHKAQITVYRCRPGTLDVTILGKSGKPVRAFVDGIRVATLETPAGTAAVHRIPTPPYADGTHACGFELQTPGYAGSTTIVFTPQ